MLFHKAIIKGFILVAICIGAMTGFVSAKAWQPSLKTNCDPSKNISPVLEDLTAALASAPADASNEQKVTAEPSILFNDETFTDLKFIDYSKLKPTSCTWADVDEKMQKNKGHNIPQSNCFTKHIKQNNYLINYLEELF